MLRRHESEREEWDRKESSANGSLGSQFSLLSGVMSNPPIEEADEIKEIKTLFNKGKKFFKNGDFVAALSSFDAGLEIEEHNANLLAARCVTYMNISQDQMAAQDAHKLVSLYPENSQCLFLLSLVLKRQGQIEESLNLLVKSLGMAKKPNQRFVEEVEETTGQFLEIPVPTGSTTKSRTDLLQRTYQVGLFLFNYQKYPVCHELLQNLMPFLDGDIKSKTLFLIASATSGLKQDDQAFQLYEESLSLALAANNLHILTLTLVELAKIHFKKDATFKSIFYFEKLIEIEGNLPEHVTNEDEQILNLWSPEFKRYLRRNLIIAYKTVLDLKRAYRYTQEYVCLVQAADCPERIKCEQFYLLGDICESLGMHALALDHYKEYLTKAEACGYGNLILKTYGALGRINGTLNNWNDVFYYHSLYAESANGIGSKDIAKAERLLADSYFWKKEFNSAIILYEKIISEPIVGFELCQIWLRLYECYLQIENPDAGLKYLERSLSRSRASGFEEITAYAELHCADLYGSSANEETLQLSELYFKRVINFLRGRIEYHLRNGIECPARFWSDLIRCYKGTQTVLVKQRRTADCLQYAEILQRVISVCHRVDSDCPFLFSCDGYWAESVNFLRESSTLKGMRDAVDRQSATVCCYSMLNQYLLIWILQPGNGIVETVVQEKNNPTIKEDIQKHLMNILQIHDESSSVLFYEGRSLPRRSGEPRKPAMPKNTDRNVCKFSSLTSLSQLLLHPIEHILSKLPDGHHLVFVASDVLRHCPFASLQNSHKAFLGERFSVTFIQSLAQLSQILANNDVKDLRLKDNTEVRFLNADRLQTAAATEVLAIRDSKSNSRSKILPDRKTVSDVNGLKSMGAPQKNCSKTNPGITNFNLQNSKGRSKNCFSTKMSPALSDQIPIIKAAEHQENIIIMTNPHIPEKTELYGKEWNSGVKNLPVAESEGCEIASSLGIFAISRTEATKSKFIELLPTATVIHIATWANVREGFLAWSPSSIPVHPDRNVTPDEVAYLVTCKEISILPLRAKLVVLSCGQDSVWRGLDDTQLAHHLPNAFLHAGAQSVLFCLRPIPDVVRKSFFKHFYDALKNGSWVSEALWKSQKYIASTKRFQDISYWSPFVIFGEDCYINLREICRTMTHQVINSVEEVVEMSSGKTLLNPRNSLSEIPTIEQKLHRLQEILGRFLHQYSFRLDLIQTLLQLITNWPGRQCSPTVGQDLRSAELPLEISTNDVCMSLLRFLGFKFVAGNVQQKDSYILLYPYQVTGSLLQEVWLALSVIQDFSMNYALIRAWRCLLPLRQELISSLIDLMYISKFVWGLQLHLADTIVRSLWQNPSTQRLLASIGYHQIGRFINFHASPRNRKFLTASLQFVVSLSCHKDETLMQEFDIKHMSLSVKSDLQFPFHTSWMRKVKPEEMKAKIQIVRKHEEMKDFYREYIEKGNRMYEAIFISQAQKVLNSPGKKSCRKANKVKVFSDSTASRERIPCIQSSLSRIEQTRGQAHRAIKQWQQEAAAEYKNIVFQVYLPYTDKRSSQNC